MRTIRINNPVRLWGARLLIGVVLFFNLQCALLFLMNPEGYMVAFEQSGSGGRVMLQGMGLLFVMWNIPYGLAFYHPVRYRVSLYEAGLMQAVGFIGETFLSLTISPTGHALLLSNVHRFMAFDGVGLLLLLLAIRVTQGITGAD